MEKYEEITKFIWVLVERQTFIFNSHERIRLDDLSWLAFDSKSGAVKEVYYKIDSRERFQ